MKQVSRILVMAAVWLGGVSAASAGSAATSRPASGPASKVAPLIPLSITLVDFNGPTIPRNKAGDTYPSQYAPTGKATISLDDQDAITGRSIRFEVLEKGLDAQFNAHNPNGTRGFAREYVAKPNAWRFNTINRLSFWIRSPVNGPAFMTGGQENFHVGTYVKRIKGSDARSDETGGGHWYHWLNIAPTGTWTKVVLNMHPHHIRGASGGQEHGIQLHPTRESEYNYFDTLTRIYIMSVRSPAASYPAVYHLDDFEFYAEPRPENDEQVYSIAATYVPESNRLILTWSRPKGENAVRHEVRYAFWDIHATGWAKAMPAPGGLIRPPGPQGYCGMAYDTTNLPLEGKRDVCLATKLENSPVFSQIVLPLRAKSREKSPQSKAHASAFWPPVADFFALCALCLPWGEDDRTLTAGKGNL